MCMMEIKYDSICANCWHGSNRNKSVVFYWYYLISEATGKGWLFILKKQGVGQLVGSVT